MFWLMSWPALYLRGFRARLGVSSQFFAPPYVANFTTSAMVTSVDQDIDACVESPENQLRSRVLLSVQKLIRRKKASQGNLQNEVVLAEKAEATNRRAKLIAGSITRDVPAWVTELDATDWETGETVKLSRDPKYESFQEESKKLFALSRRMKRGSTVVRDLLTASQEAVEKLEVVETELQEEGSDPMSQKPGLLELGLRESDFSIETKAPKARGGGEVPAKPRTPFRMFEGPDGATILVGRNSRENDQLSARVARNNDIWMHARTTAGAHVVVQSPSAKTDASPESLQMAANLAIFYSEARDARKAVVLVARARHVVKFKGAPLGAVRVRLEERSLFGFPENVPEECVLARERFCAVDETKKKDTKNRQRPRNRGPT
jgi:predicted ribosome quality control (RQC) complex YloA/Tae2 family protein